MINGCSGPSNLRLFQHLHIKKQDVGRETTIRKERLETRIQSRCKISLTAASIPSWRREGGGERRPLRLPLMDRGREGENAVTRDY